VGRHAPPGPPDQPSRAAPSIDPDDPLAPYHRRRCAPMDVYRRHRPVGGGATHRAAGGTAGPGALGRLRIRARRHRAEPRGRSSLGGRRTGAGRVGHRLDRPRQSWDLGDNRLASDTNPDHGNVEDWPGCNNPAELRIRLDVALEENVELLAKLAEPLAENEARIHATCTE
jgi:hypothetical protein